MKSLGRSSSLKTGKTASLGNKIIRCVCFIAEYVQITFHFPLKYLCDATQKEFRLALKMDDQRASLLLCNCVHDFS